MTNTVLKVPLGPWFTDPKPRVSIFTKLPKEVETLWRLGADSKLTVKWAGSVILEISHYTIYFTGAVVESYPYTIALEMAKNLDLAFEQPNCPDRSTCFVKRINNKGVSYDAK